ncbi:hypothetical protein D3C81_1640410 [compost metagenome]
MQDDGQGVRVQLRAHGAIEGDGFAGRQRLGMSGGALGGFVVDLGQPLAQGAHRGAEFVFGGHAPSQARPDINALKQRGLAGRAIAQQECKGWRRRESREERLNPLDLGSQVGSICPGPRARTGTDPLE